MGRYSRIAIVGGTALIGRDLTPVTEKAIVIEGARIAAIVDDGEIAEARVVDVAGGTVMPGFIDAHVHIGFADPKDVLRKGVTTVRDLAWPPERIYPLARASRSEDFDGPLILAAGPMLTVAGGYPITASWAPEGTGRAVGSTDDARAAVRALAADGVAVIKIALNPPAGHVLDHDTLAAIVGEAHAHGLKVTGHVYGLAELRKALDAGIDELAHMLMSPERIDDVVETMVDNNVTVVPTLSIFPVGALDIAVANLHRFLSAGGRVVYGTDLGNAGPQPGIDELEVTRMEAAGMSATDIVRAATVTAAEWLGLENKGAIDVGMDADLVVLHGDVREAKDLTRVRRVFREGKQAV